MSEYKDKWQHVAYADDSIEPFDWSDHTEDASCQCGPEVSPERAMIVHKRPAYVEAVTQEGDYA